MSEQRLDHWVEGHPAIINGNLETRGPAFIGPHRNGLQFFLPPFVASMGATEKVEDMAPVDRWRWGRQVLKAKLAAPSLMQVPASIQPVSLDLVVAFLSGDGLEILPKIRQLVKKGIVRDGQLLRELAPGSDRRRKLLEIRIEEATLTYGLSWVRRITNQMPWLEL